MGKIIALAAGKGGTGKTLLTAALGERLAARAPQVCLLDACAGLRGLDLSLGLQDQVVFDWLDLSREDCTMEQALLRGAGEGQPYLLAAPQDLLPEDVDIAQLQKLLTRLQKRFDYVLIDTPSGIGSLTRMLRDSLRELGLDQAIAEAAEAIPDARDRLYYVVQMTAQAAERALNSVEASQPHQDQMEKSAKALTQRWEDWFADPIDLADARELVTDTRQFLADVPAHTSFTNAQLLEIMMAQDFQDLTGQVIKRMMDVIQEIERQLLMVLLENIPEQESRPKRENQSLLNGPQVDTSKAGVVASQDQVDDLLDSLGF